MNSSSLSKPSPQAWPGSWSSFMDAAYPTMAHVYRAALKEAADNPALLAWLKANPPL